MGAWEVNVFKNDSALDWLEEFVQFPERSTIDVILDEILEEDYVDSWAAEEALAAVEVVAIARGKSKEKLKQLEKVDFTELNGEIDTKLIAKCVEVLDRIVKKNDQNEIYDLWEDTDTLPKWLDLIKDMKKRIKE